MIKVRKCQPAMEAYSFLEHAVGKGQVSSEECKVKSTRLQATKNEEGDEGISRISRLLL